MTETQLSSLMTFFIKFIFSTAWLSLWGLGTLSCWFAPGPLGTRLFMTAVFFAFLALFWVQAFTLKRVMLVPGGLKVSNYLHEDFVPFEDIAEVWESKWSKQRDITLGLRRPCRFGTRVRFIPETKLFLFWGDHPTATLVRERAGLLRSRVSRSRRATHPLEDEGNAT